MDMKKPQALAAAMTAALLSSAAAPALANGSGSTNTIIFLSAAAAGSVPLIVNYNHKVREKRVEEQQVTRRQDAYRDWFYHKYGYYPTYEQFRQWYVQTYNTNP
jgi:thiamine pyrophosphate-dependent acetolactate synthase large subunit-like protein